MKLTLKVAVGMAGRWNHVVHTLPNLVEPI